MGSVRGWSNSLLDEEPAMRPWLSNAAGTSADARIGFAFVEVSL